jgi:hypothetical protein
MLISSIAYEATCLVTFMLPQNLPAEFPYIGLCFQLQSSFKRVYREESDILRENVPWVNMSSYKEIYLILDGYEDNDARKMWTGWGSTYYTLSSVTHTLRKFVLESRAKPYVGSKCLEP